MSINEMCKLFNKDYQFVLFSDSGGDLHYIDDITDIKQVKEAIKVPNYF